MDLGDAGVTVSGSRTSSSSEADGGSFTGTTGRGRGDVSGPELESLNKRLAEMTAQNRALKETLQVHLSELALALAQTPKR